MFTFKVTKREQDISYSYKSEDRTRRTYLRAKNSNIRSKPTLPPILVCRDQVKSLIMASVTTFSEARQSDRHHGNLI